MNWPINLDALTWNFPIVAIAGVVLAIYVAGWLMRQGERTPTPAFECDVCGRKVGGITAKDWRYCPWCGTPRRRNRV